MSGSVSEAPEAGDLPSVDFAQLLDLPAPTFDESYDGALAGAIPTAADHPGDGPSSHADADNCLCHGLMGVWDVPEPVADPYLGLEEPDYSKFENWIPRFTRPEKPCDYCKSRRLNCYLRRGEAQCTPCLSLFRECSLSNSQTLEAFNYADGSSTFLDTLHPVDENAANEHGALTGIRPLASKGNSATGASLYSDDAPGSSKRNGIRFPRHAVKTLRDWFDMHAGHPYPTEDEKAELERKTQLKPLQIANWLANARRRRKATESTRPKTSQSPSLRPSTPAIAIPGSEKPWDELNPLERWKHSPPENEPAAITDIANAVANSGLPSDQASRSPSSGRRNRSSNGSGFSSFRAPSTTSLDTSAKSSSMTASSAAFSHGSSQSRGSFGSFNSSLAGKKDRRRRRKAIAPATRKGGDDLKRVFQCTFCTDTFKSKYDWTRHEKSLHLSLEKWICAPLGPVVVDPHTGTKKCVYCDAQNPSDDHLETHNHHQCENKGLDARTFYRKDHLRQHLRLMHGCEMTSFMDSWKSIAVNINSRCGFCAKRFTVWQERVDHLTAHFKAGARMLDWKGCRGLDPAVAAHVTNAMPPYLIGIESASPDPFSATNNSSSRLHVSKEVDEADLVNLASSDGQDCTVRPSNNGSGTKATCWEILTVRLGQCANDMAQQGVVLSDEMLQQQARRILYDSDDSWNQTAADNPEWLDLFKKAHGLDYIPNAIGGQGRQVPEDLETYGDLGLRIPFTVQLHAYNRSQAGNQISNPVNVPGPYTQMLQQRRTQFRNIYSLLSKEGVLSHDENVCCDHIDCSNNVIDVSSVDELDEPGPRYRRWCTHSTAPEKAKLLSAAAAIAETSGEPGLFMDHSSVNAATGYPDIAGGQGNQAAANTRPQDLRSLATANSREESSHSRARGLEALARLEVPMTDDNFLDSIKSQKSYLRRHQLELPPERARLFETTTGPWKDSGVIPETVRTSTDAAQAQISCYLTGNTRVPPPAVMETRVSDRTTTTGAMMEFLGGQVGGHLPFGTDATTSTIPLPTTTTSNELDWNFEPTMDEAAMISELDKMMTTSAMEPAHSQPDLTATTTAADTSSVAMGPTFSLTDRPPLPASAALDAPGDWAMEDFNFNDITFDSAFGMPVDDMTGFEDWGI